MNYEELKDWCADARRGVEREMERLQEQQQTMGNHLQVLEAAGELLAELARQKDELEQKQSEIDMLNEQLERKEQEETTKSVATTSSGGTGSSSSASSSAVSSAASSSGCGRGSASGSSIFPSPSVVSITSAALSLSAI